MAYGIFRIIFRTEVFAPVLTYVRPVKDFIGWVVEDPGRAWIALAALVIPHIGLYCLLFEDRKWCGASCSGPCSRALVPASPSI